MATLTLQLPNLPPVEHVLLDEAVTIGRMKGNTIALDDISVSLSHAKLTLRNGGYFLKDLNSTNGTMVNGQSITEVQLHDGDHVKFGEVIGRFHAGAATAPTPPAAPPAASVPASAAAPPPVAPLQTQVLPRAVLPPAPAKKSPWYPLALKVLGLSVVGLLLWKLVFNAPKPAAVTAPTAPETAKPVVSEKPAGPAPTNGAAAVPQKSGEGVPADQRLPELIKALKSPEVAERRRAVGALNALQAEALPAVPALREALQDTDAEVRMWAALSLIGNRVYDQATVPILIPVLHHEDPALRQVACLSLALIPLEAAEKEPVIAALTECVRNESNAEVKNAALSALKMVTHDSAPAGK
ncbi:MAG TPA: FHA domain-containing protein [bacterium]|nr:FHA domain-containing protein [bacterium]